MPNAVIATTMWDDVWETTGVDREQELRAQFWNSMLVDGCRLERFQNSYESAWDIIGEHSSTTLRLPDEMVDAGKQTGANEGLPNWIVGLKRAIRMR
jgi:predicted DNA binding CopG/RHH family protein